MTANATWTKMLEELMSGCVTFWSWSPPVFGGGALLPAREMAIDANTHPTMVPTNTKSWIHSNTSVVKWMPMYFGSFLRPRNERLPTMLVEAASEGVSGGVSGCEGLG